MLTSVTNPPMKSLASRRLARVAASTISCALLVVAISAVAGAQGATAGENFAPELSPDSTGSTFDYDAERGLWLQRRKLFSAVPVMGTNTPTTRMLFSSQYDKSTLFRESALDASLSTKIGLVNASAHYAQQNREGREDLSTGFVFGWECIYPRSVVDSAAVSVWDSEALEILALPEPQRTERWQQEGFGAYVATGHANRGRLAVKVSLRESARYRSRSQFFELSGSYGPTSVDASVMEAVYEARRSQGLAVEVVAEGWNSPTPFELPSTELISTPSGQAIYANQMRQQAVNARRKEGLFLKPVRDFMPGAPNIASFSWSDPLLRDASAEALGALRDIHLARRWAKPFTLQQFLAARLVPGTSESFDNALQRTRLASIDALEDLKVAVVHYAKADHALAQGADQPVRDAIGALGNRRFELANVVTGIHTMAAQLPTMSLAFSENYTPGGSSTFDNWVGIHVSVDNAAIFWDGTVPGLIETLGEWDPARSFGPVMGYVDEPNGSSNIARTTGNGGLGYFVIDSVTPLVGSNQEGLYNIKFSFGVHARNDVRDLRIGLTDQFDRYLLTPIDLLLDHDWTL